MNTPVPLLLGAAALAKGGDRKLIWAALVGALLPDLSLYLLAGTALYVLNIPAQIVFDQLYFSELWQTVFAVDNSFLVWGILLGFAIWQRIDWAIVLTGAALLHLTLDFPLHHDDGRPHFWPITSWVFESPVSYWDRSRGQNGLHPWCSCRCDLRFDPVEAEAGPGTLWPDIGAATGRADGSAGLDVRIFRCLKRKTQP
ncbi:cobalamin biosynthesis protein CobQ [Sulfitobacter sediminilitoris]|uniref:cobalamin biosynthesis protein CobQ n=1 Tax=Sulfitobacter sediminilitoris TaxID=2698830 RepID=UPI00362116AB